MTDLNTLTIIGRLTRDGELAYTTGGTARLNLSIAVNRSQKSGGEWSDKVSFFDVTVWGKTAENISPYLGKGKQIAVQGYLEQQRWEKDGQKYSKVCIIANQVQLLGGKNAETPQQSQGYTDARSDDDFQEEIPF
ncbi:MULTISPECIES: single-stranded DNA-binding protein [unclassified Treponema]|uniref:single-stranded DNA-binding protein n=1 Tax=unclassified Treponema TaxID=2638727 RepID=UPI0020A458BC|nr:MULTISPECIES: single-stranded DNA-binding protein [unclassified Treponema]UTC65988.1 single-stranded DNA-binding protein [Treponema sp. OMZ 789]UTC68718.1 single-stranded DNA-binding protein [Treponema sp. OMZ 790]UTC71448.1 single-stranded DNA-binding protein [Treponema sp. OMZ 791]